jgi:hypothetical protein
MSATNKSPFVRSSSKDGKPAMGKGLVKAGSTQAIKVGELICLNKTYSGYFSPVALAADPMLFPLAIAAEEQKSTDSERYIDIYTLAPEDVFHFAINAARSLAIGDVFVPTASNSQQLTYDADGGICARQVDFGHYPQSTDTTVPNMSYAQVSFDIRCTYYGLVQTALGRGLAGRVYTSGATAITLTVYQSGLTLSNYGADANTAIHVLPDNAPLGTKFTAVCMTAFDTGFDAGASDKISVEAAEGAAAGQVTVDAIGDSIIIEKVYANKWFAHAIVSSASDQTGAIDVA